MAERFLPMLWLVALGCAMLMIVTGGFDTDRIPLPARAAFWLFLIGWNTAKWQLWFALWVRRPRDWMRAALAGTPILNLSMPIEVWAGLRIVGVEEAMPDLLGTWTRALAIALGIAATMALAGLWIARRNRTAERAMPLPPPDGLLHRARVTADALLAIEAEDHYCRVFRRDGHSMLVHHRFGDALDEVRGIDGEQVHRGTWVAGWAVAGAVREGRRWLLVLADSRRVPVSSSYLERVRARGWLLPPPPPERDAAGARSDVAFGRPSA